MTRVKYFMQGAILKLYCTLVDKHFMACISDVPLNYADHRILFFGPASFDQLRVEHPLEVVLTMELSASLEKKSKKKKK